MMTFQSVPEAIPVGIAAAISLVLAVLAWRRRAMPLARPFAVMMAGETLWALGAALEPIVVELPMKRLCIDIRMLGTMMGILSLVAFVFRYTGRSHWTRSWWFRATCAAAGPLLVLAWTDPWHHLYWKSLDKVNIAGSMIAVRTHGPGLWAMIVYCYALAAVTTVLLLQAVIRFTGVYRAQAALMLFGVLLPWVVDVMDMRRMFGFIPVDLVSMSFAVTGLTFVPAVVWLRLLDLAPVAWAAAVELIGDPIVVIDASRRIVAVNPAARKLVGRPDRDLIGADAAGAFAGWPALAGRFAEIAAPGETRFEIDRPGSEGPSVFDARVSSLSGEEGASGWVLVLRDVTARKRAEEERARVIQAQAARAEAEAANRAKDRFLAMLSHELRTPLTPVLVTVTAMLEDPATAPSVRPVLEMIHRNIDLEAHLIDDLLDVTRIGSGKLHLKRVVLDAHEHIERALEICSDAAAGAHVALDAQLEAGLHHIHADPTRFQQVLWNLIQNAIKFTPPEGTVTIRSRNRDESSPGEGGCWLVIEVIDQGKGIEPDLLPRIFEAFEQGGPATGQRYGGLGLGLAISRSIVEAHEGRLTAASEGPGKGATLALELRTAPAITRPVVRASGPAATALPRPLKILLVEDNTDTRDYLAGTLARRGHDVRTAGRLASALHEAGEHEFELLISDIELPDGSGLELMWKLRDRGPIKGIALSGFGSSDDIDQSLSAGFAEHLTKPVDFRRLEEAILHVAADNPGGEARGPC